MMPWCCDVCDFQVGVFAGGEPAGLVVLDVCKIFIHTVNFRPLTGCLIDCVVRFFTPYQSQFQPLNRVSDILWIFCTQNKFKFFVKLKLVCGQTNLSSVVNLN